MPGVVVPDMAFHSTEALRAAAGGNLTLKLREFYDHCREALHHVGQGESTVISSTHLRSAS